MWTQGGIQANDLKTPSAFLISHLQPNNADWKYKKAIFHIPPPSLSPALPSISRPSRGLLHNFGRSSSPLWSPFPGLSDGCPTSAHKCAAVYTEPYIEAGWLRQLSA